MRLDRPLRSASRACCNCGTACQHLSKTAWILADGNSVATVACQPSGWTSIDLSAQEDWALRSSSCGNIWVARDYLASRYFSAPVQVFRQAKFVEPPGREKHIKCNSIRLQSKTERSGCKIEAQALTSCAYLCYVPA